MKASAHRNFGFLLGTQRNGIQINNNKHNKRLIKNIELKKHIGPLNVEHIYQGNAYYLQVGKSLLIPSSKSPR